MNDEAQVEENLRIAADARPGSLTAAEAGLVESVGRKYREIMKVGCTGCGYCQPCPSGVDIPGCFDSFNAFHTFGKTREARFQYVLRGSGMLSGHPAYASLCAQCRACLEKCPQSLAIPDLLEQVSSQFEGDGLKDVEALVRGMFQN
jgi:predicted aldo/keto reductase-like oxidoreductase